MGFAYVIVGLSLFLVGLEMALFPLGETMAVQLTTPDFLREFKVSLGQKLEWIDYYWVYTFAFLLALAPRLQSRR